MIALALIRVANGGQFMKYAYRALFAGALMTGVCMPAFAQEVPVTEASTVVEPAVMAAPVAPVGNRKVLPANTEVLLSVNEDVTSKRVDEGDKFRLTVVHDVVSGNHVVIPRGTGAVGEVVWKTGKGAFGKSGKMEIELRYIDLNGRSIPVTGKYRQEGEGNTVATVAGVVAAGVFAAFITGKSARIPQGRELKAYTRDPLPFAVAEVPAPAPVVATPASAPVAAPTPSTD
jgi:hypothetical protein